MTTQIDILLTAIVSLATIASSLGGIKVYKRYSKSGIPDDPEEYRKEIHTMLNSLISNDKAMHAHIDTSISSMDTRLVSLFTKMKERDEKLNRACNDVCAVIKYLKINAENGELRELDILLGDRGRR